MADNDNTPLGNLLGFIGFFAGCSIGWNATENGIAALIAGVILACIGAFLGNLAWRIIIIVISIAIAVISFQIRREVTSAVASGIREGIETRDEPSTYEPYQASNLNYVTCITNTTSNLIYYQYRWGEIGEWEQIELKPGWHRWHSNGSNIKFRIKFDYSYQDGYQHREYYLLTYNTSGNPTCDNAKKYDFYINGNEIDMKYTD